MSDYVLHLGDCVEGMARLEDKSVDHVIADPPYEPEAHSLARRQSRGPNTLAEDYQIDFRSITEPERIAVAAQMTRLARSWILVFCQVEAVDKWRAALVGAGAKWKRACAWVKPDGAPQFTGDRPAQGFECIAVAWAGIGRSRWNGGGKRGVYTYCVNDYGRESRPHPTSKPLDLMRALVSDFTDPGEVILDSHMGSGTTGLACLELGRRFMGFELDPKHYATAQERLANAQKQESLFKPKAQQQSLALGVG